MHCAFQKVGNHNPCQLKPTNYSKYCKMHIYLMKKSKVSPALFVAEAVTQNIEFV